MNNTINSGRALLRHQIEAWLPVLITMAAIFILSAQPKYPPPSPTTDVYFSGVIPVFPGFWEIVVKKGAHLVAFGSLALLGMRAFTLAGLPLRRASYAAIVVTTLYALTDEFHQSFTAGRTASGIDIGLDFVGATCAVLLARYLHQFMLKQRQTRRHVNAN